MNTYVCIEHTQDKYLKRTKYVFFIAITLSIMKNKYEKKKQNKTKKQLVNGNLENTETN